MSAPDYTIAPEIPSVEDFLRLRRVAGMSPRPVDGAAKGLPNSIFAITVRASGRAIGMGRLIGDGGTAFLITDICVEPEFQGHGIGKAIMAMLMDHVNTHLPKGCMVSLIADGDAQHLYAKFGFNSVAPESIGMDYRVV